jgi:hypothetical protein
MAIDFNDKQSMELFLERYESGDPLKDWYSDSEIQEALAKSIELLLGAIETVQSC